VNDLTQREFLIELEELTEQLFAVNADLRRQEAAGPQQREILARAFRCLHSIKGVASSAGFTTVAELAHQTENVLDTKRTGRIEIDTTFVDTLEDVADAISENLGNAEAAGPAPSNELLFLRLRSLAASAIRSFAKISPIDLPVEIAASLNEREMQLIVEAFRENTNVCLINANFDIAVFDTEFQKLRDTLAHYGEVIFTQPSAEGPAANRIGFRLFYTSEFAAAEVQTRILAAVPEATVTDLSQPLAADPDEMKRQRAASAISANATLQSSGSVRVELDELERLRVSAHEVFEQIVGALDLFSASLKGGARTELSNLDAQVRQTLGALEEKIVDLRTVSADRLIQRTIVAGRVAARSAGKEVEFSGGGSDVRIDKEICDAIATPLLHLIRNAVDHGIETPAERTNAGKTPAGTIRIEARASGGETLLIVSDDGCGIDPQVISLAAATRGLVEQGTMLDMDQSLRMIFHPGFSSTAMVSNLSGRGVGLDVVEHSLTQIGGSVSVRSWPGNGCQFELRLPKTLSKS